MDIISLLLRAREQGASDLHCALGKAPVFRIDGQLLPCDLPILTAEKIQEYVATLIPDVDPKTLAKADSKNHGVLYEIPGAGRFRVSIFSSRGELGCAVRVVPDIIPSMEDIGLSEAVKNFTNLQNGLVLVTGPNGSGKSTTLASMINHIAATQSRHIVTLEDPIEFLFEHQSSVVHQRELGADFNTFAETLKHLVRHNSDVVMVGEMRDLDTIAATLTLAETGHLVFATLHTVNAPQTITRIIDAFPADQQDQIRGQLSMSLRGVVSQSLLPAQSGGRVAVREILVNTPAVATLIRDNKLEQIPSVMQTSMQEGMVTREQSLASLRLAGTIAKATNS